MSDSYYTDTAYDSSKVNAMPWPDNSGFNATTRKLRKRPLPNFPAAQCREFLCADHIRVIELLSSDKAEDRNDMASPGHEIQEWQTLRNPKVAIEVVTHVMRFFSVISWVGALFISMLILVKKPSVMLAGSFLYLFLLPSIFLSMYFIGTVALKKQIFKDKNNIILNRRKGTILRPSKRNPAQEIPFEEFDAYLGTSINSSGLTCYHLWLCHRYSQLWISHPGEHYEPWRINQLWEFWQQYMDISQPLPDTPKIEPFRSRDPVTSAYDRKHNRPPDYWKNMDLTKAGKMKDAALSAGSEYPWGASRKQALVQGWEPSGYGEGDWNSNQQEL